jgi:uncharacterized protein YegL
MGFSMFNRRMSFVVLVALILWYAHVASTAVAQGRGGGGFGGGGSSASLTAVRSGICPSPEAIVVEEFFNYHMHDIPVPKDNVGVGMNVRWGNRVTSPSQRYAYMQIGLATKRDVELEHLPPVNVAFLVDSSGSMAGERLRNVKKALTTAVARLRAIDRVSLVSFATEAKVVVPSMLLQDGPFLAGVEKLESFGSTNLADGLAQAYEEVVRHFDRANSNRVILLTDGRANRESSIHKDMVELSAARHADGISLSAIAVGDDYNHDLLRELAKAGHGPIHFVGHDRDIQKIFVEELDGLLTTIAENVVVRVEYPRQVKLDHVYGYDPQFENQAVQFSLDPLNSGSTQVLLLRFQVDDRLDTSGKIPMRVRLTYNEYSSQGIGRASLLRGGLEFNARKRQAADPLLEESVRRNVTIADIAQGIHGMSQLIEENKPDVARQHMAGELTRATRRYRRKKDPEVARVVAVAVGYVRKLDQLDLRR